MIFSSCLLLTTATQLLRFDAHTDNGIRCRVVPLNDGNFTIRDDLYSSLVNTDGHGDDCLSGYSFTNGNLQVNYDDKTDLLTYIRVSDGYILLSEQSPRSFTPVTDTENTPISLAQNYRSLALNFAANDGERIFGLGQHKTGQLDNKNNGGLSLKPENTEILIPIAHSSLGYAFLLNLPSYGRVEYNDTASFWLADAVLQADFWVATTSDSPPHDTSPWAQLQLAYADATGHAKRLPKGEFEGFWQSKNRYHNATQFVDVANRNLEEGVPLNVMIIDYRSWEPAPLGDESMSPDCWPDPVEMVATLKAKNVNTMISPYFHNVDAKSENFQDAKENNFLALNQDFEPDGSGYFSAYM